MLLKPSQRMYGNVYSALAQLLPNECDTRLTNMVFLRGCLKRGRLIDKLKG